MKQSFKLAIFILLLSLNVNAYDLTKAQELDAFYSHMTQKTCAHSKLFIKAKDIMKMLREKKPFTLIDVRTLGEEAVISLSGDNALYIPLDILFKKENLDKLPTDQPLVLVCHTGTRATLAAIGLKRLGFKKIHVVKGGLVALAEATNPKNAPIK